MILSALTLLLCTTGTLLQVQTVPWSPEESSCFVADATLDGTAEVFVLNGHTLRVYGRRAAAPLFTVELPPGTSALDVADVDRDGTADVIAVCGDQILQFPLREGSAEPMVLFTVDSQFSHVTGLPFSTVLVVDRDHKPRIALPRSQALDVHELSGDVVESYPINVDTPYHLSDGRPFNFGISQNTQSGPASALEFRISSVVTFKAAASETSLPIEDGTPTARLGTSRQQWEAEEMDPESWPWFPVGTGPTGAIRALYRTADARVSATSIRVRSLPLEGSDGTMAETKIGPSRQYPGTLLLQERYAPDLNGDGFTDIVLWKSREPSLTADRLARIASSGTWPLSITSHVFLPDKHRFAPRAATQITADIPVAWLFSNAGQGPLRLYVLRDFDGDGKTDFACLTADDTYTAWRSDGEGLEREPAFQQRFSAAVDELMFETDLEGDGRATVGLRAGSALHIIRPWSLSTFH